MKLPRWTVFPALAILAVFLIPAIPGRDERRGGSADPRPTKHKKVVMLGIDGMDPDILREVIATHPGGMTSFVKLIAQGGIHELGTSTPPQSPVAWSNFITGMDPGGHGVFDFIHRDLVTRAPAPATVKGEAAKSLGLLGDWQLPLGGSSESNRTGKAFWQLLAEKGIPADIWRMPANFPVEPSLGLSFSGMFTPAVDSAYGKYSFYSSDPPAESLTREGKVVPVREYDGRIDTFLSGPPNSFKASGESARIPLKVRVDREAQAAVVEIADTAIVLQPGQWSDFARVSFDLLPAGASKVQGIVRFYLRRLDPFEMYASPVNIDPAAPIAPVSEPVDASAKLAERIGLFYTQGMPEDVNALKDRVLSDEEFMAQSALVHQEGVAMLDYALERWYEEDEGGFLFLYFSGVDLCGHMMWRHHDEQHPHHDKLFAARDSSNWSQRAGSTWKDVIHDLYLHMDPILGRVLESAGPDATVIVMSDHGFAPYGRKFSLNTWLFENGYLVLKDGFSKEAPEGDPEWKSVYIFDAVDWSKTRAYGMGFQGLYLNLAGRERDNPETPENEAGIVQPGAEADALLEEIQAKLEALRDDGVPVVLRADRARDVFHGTRVAEAPDLVVGYNSNYGNSDEASTGRIPHAVLEQNLGGTFNGSHLMAPEVVPGMLLTNQRVRVGAHRLEDLTVEILRQYRIEPPKELLGRPVLE